MIGTLPLIVLCVASGVVFVEHSRAAARKEVVRKYVEAVEEGDEKTAVMLVSGRDMEEAKAKRSQAAKNAKYGNPVITDDIATVDVTPVSVSKAYLKKIDGKWKVVSESEAEIEAIVKSAKDTKSVSYGEAKIDGEMATVTVTHSVNGKDRVLDYKLKKVDGKWKITDIVPHKEKK